MIMSDNTEPPLEGIASYTDFFTKLLSTAKLGDNVLDSIRQSVRYTLPAGPFKCHYRPKVIQQYINSGVETPYKEL